MAYLRQVVFSQTGHFHDRIAVDIVLQHGTGYFQGRFALFCEGSDRGILATGTHFQRVDQLRVLIISLRPIAVSILLRQPSIISNRPSIGTMLLC